MSMIERRQLLLASLASALLAACGSASAEAQLGPEQPEAPPEVPRDADQIARDLASAKLGVSLNDERVGDHPLRAKLAALNPWGKLFDGTGIDPSRDLQRGYVAAANVRDESRVVAVAEHALDSAKLHAALEKVIQRSDPPGTWLKDRAVPAARITVQGHKRVVAMPTDTLLVVVSPPLAGGVERFVNSGGLPQSNGPEAVTLDAADPARTLAAPGAPAVPGTIRSAQAQVVLTPDGGADLHVQGQSTTAVQAVADAKALTKSLADATSLNLGFAKVQLFEAIRFRAEGDQVLGDRHFTAAELDKLLSLAAALIPRGG
jgi:hypothetical protein